MDAIRLGRLVATSPFQHALSTRAVTECVTHVLKTLTDLDERATILSVDGIGAYDLISRHAMLSGLRDMEDGAELLPFVSSFYGRPSTYLWEDELGVVHDIQQGEGGEQGDALMPIFVQLGTTSCVGGHCGAVAREREAVCVP